MNTRIILIIILIIGLFLRVVNIDNNPPALYGDELTIGLDAYSLLHTGQDQLGNRFPLTFPMGAGRPAGYVYFSIPFVAIFGPTPMGIRGLSIVSGLGIILLLYYIGRKLFSQKVGLVASAITTFSIWDISLSRGGYEAHFALFLTLVALSTFILAERKKWLYLISAISFGIALNTYPTYKLTLPLFLILLIWFCDGFKRLVREDFRKYTVSALVILTLSAFLAASQTFTGGSETRFSNINIFAQKDLLESITQKVNFERSQSLLPQSVSKYFHNKPVEYGKILIENYLQNFSLDFLVLHGDRNPRHNMATMGQFYFAEVILLFLGVVFLWQRRKKTLMFLMLWLLIAPLTSAIISSPHALRSSFMLPPLILISSYGLTSILFFRQRLVLIIVGIIFVIQFIFFIQKLYFLAPNEYGNFWSYSAKLASEKALENRNNFNYIILSDRIDNIEFAYPVYAKTEPIRIIDQNKERSILMGYRFKRFDNVYIGNLPGNEALKLISKLDGKVLYIGDATEVNNFPDYEILQGLDKMPALLLFKDKL